jgi:hypothetical protein
VLTLEEVEVALEYVKVWYYGTNWTRYVYASETPQGLPLSKTCSPRTAAKLMKRYPLLFKPGNCAPHAAVAYHRGSFTEEDFNKAYHDVAEAFDPEVYQMEHERWVCKGDAYYRCLGLRGPYVYKRLYLYKEKIERGIITPY